MSYSIAPLLCRAGFTGTSRFFLLRSLRSRNLIGLGVLVAFVCWWDAAGLSESAASWSTAPLLITPLVAILLGYDTYERLKVEGSLRLILLRAEPRLCLAAAFLFSAALIALGCILLVLSYLAVVGRVGAIQLLAGLPVFIAAACAFVAYAQALSLVLPRDAAAIAAIIGYFFGAGSYDRWLPPATPEIVKTIAHGLWLSIPTSARLSSALSGEALALNTALFFVQAVLGVWLISALLGRRSLLVRNRVEP